MASEQPQLFFRNYKPRDPELQQLMIPKPEIPKIEIDIKTDIISEVNGRIDFKTLYPERDTLDLERDIEEKMEKLQRRTEKALDRLALTPIKQQQT